MKEALVILAILFVLVTLTAIRYRKQLMMLVHVWRMLKNARSGTGADEKKIDKPEDVPLVNCAKCGAWVSSSEAVKIGSNTFLCTEKCMRSPMPAV